MKTPNIPLLPPRPGTTAPRGAIGFPIIYLLFGGGLFGAVVIYILVRMIGG